MAEYKRLYNLKDLECKKLLQTKELNITFADMLNELCFAYNEETQKIFLSHQRENATVQTALINTALNSLGIDHTYQENINLSKRFLQNTFSLLKAKDYQENPYNSLIKCVNIKENNFRIQTIKFNKYSFLPYNEITVHENDYYREESHIAFTINDYPYLALLENNDIWMCITPNEINTMKPYINKAEGNVLVIGLGLGYYSYMISNKLNVKSITIIENNKSVINLFSNYILPLINNRNKIKIIYADGVDYLLKHYSQYDYCFVDIWHNPNDGLPFYIKIMESIKNTTNISFWLEKSIISLYRRCLITVIEEQLHGSNEKNYLKAKNETDKIINSIYFKTKDIEINSYNDIDILLKDDSIKKIIIK